ncbi:unnamed protein product [Sphagnum troendelagicum]|uniref:Uncharacterized protein n=1 Tax=Sphagnum troendelagicum TaxID=128251 RepID=A0ABP0TY09_9BRYO
MSGKRLSRYVKDNDVHYGLKVTHRDPKSSKVIGLQCRFCITFGREEKVGSKRKAATIDHDADEELAVRLRLMLYIFDIVKQQQRRKSEHYRCLSVESEDDVAIYSYSVTIPKTKTTLFHLAMHYVSCKTSFRMASELIGCTYDVLGNPSLHVCSRDEISNFV